MILNLDNLLHIDMDKVSFVDAEDGTIVIDGMLMYGGSVQRYIDTIADAFKYIHKSYTYDKNLKRIK